MGYGQWGGEWVGLGSKTDRLFNLLVLLGFKVIKVSILSVNTTNKLSFVYLDLQGLSRNRSLASKLA